MVDLKSRSTGKFPNDKLIELIGLEDPFLTDRYRDGTKFLPDLLLSTFQSDNILHRETNNSNSN